LAATTIAAIYKDRWAVELFFKALKQNLKIKTFVGTSATAVKTQVWTVLIAMLLLRFMQLRAKWGMVDVESGGAADESVHPSGPVRLARQPFRRATRHTCARAGSHGILTWTV
jgi:IS4 transposase